jgi:hypothetical protein
MLLQEPHFWGKTGAEKVLKWARWLFNLLICLKNLQRNHKYKMSCGFSHSHYGSAVFLIYFLQNLKLHRTQLLPFRLIYIVGKYSEFNAITSLLRLNKYVCPLHLKIWGWMQIANSSSRPTFQFPNSDLLVPLLLRYCNSILLQCTRRATALRQHSLHLPHFQLPYLNDDSNLSLSRHEDKLQPKLLLAEKAI